MNEETQLQRPILIIDATNLFIRSYSAYPQMTSRGEQIGGAVGFLKTTRRLIDDIKPSAVYVVWESGGSPQRRALYPDYKKDRRPVRLNRFYDDDIPESEENKAHQIVVLLESLKCTPICQLYVRDCEADDVIAWLCRSKFLKHEKVIASSDKDMFQLLDEKTRQYSLHMKRMVTHDDIFEQHRIMPWNFALAKALCGDPSDNIPGVKGVGFKTAVKKIPMLSSHEDVLLQDVLDFCHSNSKGDKVLQRIVENQDTVRRNWQLVHLDSSTLHHTLAARVNTQVDSFRPIGDKSKFIRSLIKEGIVEFDVEGFFYTFMCIDGYSFGV